MKRTAAAGASVRANQKGGQRWQLQGRGRDVLYNMPPCMKVELVYLPVQRQEAEPLACAIAVETAHFPSLPHFLPSAAPKALAGSSLGQGQWSCGEDRKPEWVVHPTPRSLAASSTPAPKTVIYPLTILFSIVRYSHQAVLEPQKGSREAYRKEGNLSLAQTANPST